MGTLKGFLQPKVEKTKEIELSERFKDPETGEIMKWKIRKLDVAENQQLQDESIKRVPNGKDTYSMDLDVMKYQNLLMSKSVVEPDLNMADIQDFYGVVGAEKVLPVMLENDEYNALLEEVTEINGLNQSLKDKVEEAKN